MGVSKENRRLAVFGIGQIADLVSFYFKNSNRIIDCYIVDDMTIQTNKFMNRPIFQVTDFLLNHMPKSMDIFVAISYHHQNTWREKYFNLFQTKGYHNANYISDHAYIEKDVKVGTNCMILEGAVIQKSSEVVDNSFIWTGVQVGHHSVIGKNSFIGSGAVLMGCNTIGRNSHLSANCTIKDHVKIVDNSYILPGSVISEDN